MSNTLDIGAEPLRGKPKLRWTYQWSYRYILDVVVQIKVRHIQNQTLQNRKRHPKLKMDPLGVSSDQSNGSSTSKITSTSTQALAKPHKSKQKYSGRSQEDVKRALQEASITIEDRRAKFDASLMAGFDLNKDAIKEAEEAAKEKHMAEMGQKGKKAKFLSKMFRKSG